MAKEHILLSRMATVARRREPLLTKFLSLYNFFKYDPQNVLEITVESDYFLCEEEERKHRFIHIEVEDVMMKQPKHFIIGCRIRTSSNAANEIIYSIFSKPDLDIEINSEVKIPKNRAQMHINTIFTQVKRNVWVLYGRFSERILRDEHISRHSYIN